MPTGGGTVRINKMPAQPAGIELTIEESRDWAGYTNQRAIRVIEEVTIGRADVCDLPVQDETVSSKHAKITREGDKLFITDLHSSNGTTMNGTPLLADERVPLLSGAKLVIGRTTLVIRFEA